MNVLSPANHFSPSGVNDGTALPECPGVSAYWGFNIGVSPKFCFHKSRRSEFNVQPEENSKVSSISLAPCGRGEGEGWMPLNLSNILMTNEDVTRLGSTIYSTIQAFG